MYNRFMSSSHKLHNIDTVVVAKYREFKTLVLTVVFSCSNCITHHLLAVSYYLLLFANCNSLHFLFTSFFLSSLFFCLHRNNLFLFIRVLFKWCFLMIIYFFSSSYVQQKKTFKNHFIRLHWIDRQFYTENKLCFSSFF